MTRTAIIFLTLMACLMIGTSAALAAPRASATYKLSVTLPPSVQTSSAQENTSTLLFSDAARQQITEEIVTTDDHRRVLRRTTVVR